MKFLRIMGDVHGSLSSYVKIADQVPCSIQLGDLGDKYDRMSALDHKRHVFVGGNHDNWFVKPRPDLTKEQVVPKSNLTFIETKDRFSLDEDIWYQIKLRKHLPLEGQQEEDGVFEFSNMPLHHLGNYGVWKIPGISDDRRLSGDVFFVRGAWSIDQRYRIQYNYNWYPREQMSLEECSRAVAYYEKTKPDFVVSHEAPFSIVKNLKLGLNGGGIPIPNTTNRMLELMLSIHRPKLWIFAHYHQCWHSSIDGTQFVCLNQFPRSGWSLDFDEHLMISGFDCYESPDLGE